MVAWGSTWAPSPANNRKSPPEAQRPRVPAVGLLGVVVKESCSGLSSWKSQQRDAGVGMLSLTQGSPSGGTEAFPKSSTVLVGPPGSGRSCPGCAEEAGERAVGLFWPSPALRGALNMQRVTSKEPGPWGGLARLRSLRGRSRDLGEWSPRDGADLQL